MRLAEAAGLHKDDIIFNTPLPYIDLKPHSWRRLKTKSSARYIPLFGASFWAARRLKTDDSRYVFSRYCDGRVCNANSASAAINKWLKPRVPENCVIHSFRHSMRDRLRAVKCPSETIEQIGGWTSGKIGENYGDGFDACSKHNFMTQI